jgi:hypothetical protein
VYIPGASFCCIHPIKVSDGSFYTNNLQLVSFPPHTPVYPILVFFPPALTQGGEGCGYDRNPQSQSRRLAMDPVGCINLAPDAVEHRRGRATLCRRMARWSDAAEGSGPPRAQADARAARGHHQLEAVQGLQYMSMDYNMAHYSYSW